MDKYWATIANSMKNSLIYKANSFIRVLVAAFSFLALFYFWLAIYAQGNQIGTYTFKEIVSYYIFLTLFELIIMSLDISWSIGAEIKNGQIIGSILRPIEYLKYKFFQIVGGLFYRLIIFIPPFLLVLFFLKQYLILNQSFLVYVIFAGSCLLSFVLYFLLYFIVGILTFWAMDFYGLNYISFVIINFMQGGLIPLDLLPEWFSILSEFLPFRYLFFVPVSFVTGRISFSWLMIIIPIFWCAFFYLLAQFLYQKGLKKYEGYGI